MLEIALAILILALLVALWVLWQYIKALVVLVKTSWKIGVLWSAKDGWSYFWKELTKW